MASWTELCLPGWMGAPGEEAKEGACLPGPGGMGVGLLGFLASQKHFVLLACLPAWLRRALIADGFVPNVFL